LMQGVSLRIDVRNPNGQSVFDASTVLGDLVPGGSRVGNASVVLTNAMQGVYQVTGSLLDGNGATVATAGAAFQVQEDPRVTVVGEAAVAATTVTTTQGQVCTSTVRNIGAQDIAVQPVRYLVVHLSQQQEQSISQVEVAINLAAGASATDVRSVNTLTFTPGDYACVLQAQTAGEWRTLAHAVFAVMLPPIRIDSALSVGKHGRVLVLVDAAPTPLQATDPFGPNNAPDLNTQRAHIDSVLQTNGWSYTIVDNATSFETEFDAGGYEIVAVLAEVVKIPEALQDRVVAAVAKGLGLIVAGNHDNRNGRLYAALGIKSTGKNLDASALKMLESEVMNAAEASFPVVTPPNAILLDGATQIAQYKLINPKSGQEAAESSVTLYRFGLGKGVYAGFDLPLEGAAAGDDSLFGQLFAKSLEFVHPAILTPYGKRVIPIELTLTNVGVATPGRVIVSLPVGAQAVDVGQGVLQQNNTVIWSFALTQGEQLKLPFWIRLPEVIGDVMVNAHIQVGTEGNYQDHADSALVIRVEVRP